MLTKAFNFICRYFDIERERNGHGMDRITTMMCIFMIIPIIIGFGVYGAQYADEIEAAKGTQWSFLDSGPLWIIVSESFLFMLIVYVLVRLKQKRVTGDERAVLYIMTCISLLVITYAEGGGGWSTHVSLIALPTIGATIDLNGSLILLSVNLIALVVTVTKTAKEFYPSFLRFEVPVNSVMASYMYICSVFAAALVPMMLMQWLRRERTRREEGTKFVTEVTELLVTMNTAAAQKKIDEREQAEHKSDPMTQAAKKLTSNLNVFRSYLPFSLLSAEEFDDDEPEGDEGDAEVNDDENEAMNQQIVEKSNFKKRWSTVMHISVTNLATDQSEAEKISARVSEAVIPKVIQSRGVVDQLSPNSILASFNCHVPCVIHETEASNCALSIAADLSQYADVSFCIIVSSGYNLIGSCGVDTHRAKVIIGESVEVALKIPSLAFTQLGCRIILTEDTANKVGCEVVPIDTVAVRFNGRGEKTVTLYELRSARKENAPASLASAYSNAFSQFRMGDYTAAAAMWRNYVERNQSDFQAKRILTVCERLDRDDGVQNGPYVRHELQWEPLEGDVSLIANEGAFNFSSPSMLKTSETGNDGGARGGDIMDQVKKKLEQGKEELVQQDEDEGLFTMFVVDGGDDDDGEGGGNSNANPNADDLSTEVPKEFADATSSTWQRSDKMIGEGAFSHVYLSLGEQGNLVAMKCFSLAKSGTNESELVTEVDTLSRLRNDYIVGYVSYAITTNYFIILMEYVSGGSLYQLLHQFGPLPIQAAKRYFIDVLKGLRYLHDNGIVHCDIKPHNALLSNDGTCKLSDFGSSVGNAGRGGGENGAESDNIVRGTSWYISPEAARSDVVMASDIWSVGITLIEMLTGKVPWPQPWRGGDANFILTLGKDETMMPTIPDSVPKDARDVMVACLQRDPSKRPSVQQLLLMPFCT